MLALLVLTSLTVCLSVSSPNISSCLDCDKFLHLDTSKFLPNIQKRVKHISSFPVKQQHCAQLYIDEKNLNLPLVWPPPNITNIMDNYREYYDDLTLGGQTEVRRGYHAARYNGVSKADMWDRKVIEGFMGKASTCAYYKKDTCEQSFKKYGPSHIRGKVGMVIGSEQPWAEGLAFRYGAKEIITQEYRTISTNFPHLQVMHPSAVAKKFLSSEIPVFDFIFTFSSLEHSGLGRYGDPLDPFGDTLAIAKAKCLLKEGGLLFLGFPVGRDIVVFNAHRIYGHQRLHLILSLGFELEDVIGEGAESFGLRNDRVRHVFQPIVVLRKVS